MLVIIKHIPREFNKPALELLLKSIVDNAFWFGKGEVRDVHLVQAENRKGSIMEYHCISMIEPQAAAHRVIRILNGRTILGITLHVEEYAVRNWRNDRRQEGRYKHVAREKRAGERRRYLKISSRSG